jgi:hypothetical protein
LTLAGRKNSPEKSGKKFPAECQRGAGKSPGTMSFFLRVIGADTRRGFFGREFIKFFAIDVNFAMRRLWENRKVEKETENRKKADELE